MTQAAPEFGARTSAFPDPDHPAIVEGVNVDVVATAVRACAGVADLHSGSFGEVATYLPGRRVSGVVIDKDTVTIQVVSRWAVPTSELLSQISSALSPLRYRQGLRVIVADINDPPDADIADVAL